MCFLTRIRVIFWNIDSSWLVQFSLTDAWSAHEVFIRLDYQLSGAGFWFLPGQEDACDAMEVGCVLRTLLVGRPWGRGCTTCPYMTGIRKWSRLRPFFTFFRFYANRQVHAFACGIFMIYHMYVPHIYYILTVYRSIRYICIYSYLSYNIIHSFFPDIYIVPLQETYSEAQHWRCIDSFQPWMRN